VVNNSQTAEEGGGFFLATGVDWEPLSLLRLQIKKMAKVWSAGLGFSALRRAGGSEAKTDNLPRLS